MNAIEPQPKLVMLQLNPDKFLTDRLALLIKEGTRILVKSDFEQDWIEGEYRCRPWFGDPEKAECYPGIVFNRCGREKWEPILRHMEVKLA